MRVRQSLRRGLSRHKRLPPRETRVPSIYSTTLTTQLTDAHPVMNDAQGSFALKRNKTMNDRKRFDPECGPPSNLRMSVHAAGLDQYLRDRLVTYVRAEYCGSEDSGGFIAIEFTRADGAYCHIADGQTHLLIKATFRALLVARHPSWCQGHGSCGDFRWDLHRDSLTHTHYIRGECQERITHHGLS
jgi:hypothetical protein